MILYTYLLLPFLVFLDYFYNIIFLYLVLPLYFFGNKKFFDSFFIYNEKKMISIIPSFNKTNSNIIKIHSFLN